MSCSPPRDASQNPAGPTQRFEHVTHPSLYFTSCSATLCSRTCLVIHLSVITGALASCLLVLGCEYALSWSRTTRSILRHRRTFATSASCAWLAECFSLLCRDYKAILCKLQDTDGKGRSHSADLWIAFDCSPADFNSRSGFICPAFYSECPPS